MNPEYLTTAFFLAISAGIIIAALFWVQRRQISRGYHPGNSAFLAFVLIGIYLFLQASDNYTDSLLAKSLLGIGILLVTNTLLQLLEIGVWKYLISSNRAAHIPRLLIDIFNLLILLVAALAVLNRVFGADLSGLLVTSTVLSAVIGLAFQDVLTNIIAGLALQLDRRFEVGDWVNINNHDGMIVEMNWRTITLQDIDNRHIIVANASVAKADIVNYTRPTNLIRLHAFVGLGYEHPPGKIIKILLEAVLSVDEVCKDPPPDVLVHEYSDSSITYDVRFWITNFEQNPEISSIVRARIWYAIRRAGMSVPFPIRDVNLRTISDNEEQIVNQRRVQRIFDNLRILELFEALSDDIVLRLSEQAHFEQFNDGETLVRQGDTGDSLFVIVTGHVRVVLESPTGHQTTLAVHGPQNFFGEMSLLTGEKRSASVRAVGEVEVIVVNKNALVSVLNTALSTLEPLSRALESRLKSIAQHTAAHQEREIGTDEIASGTLLRKIRSFLGL